MYWGSKHMVHCLYYGKAMNQTVDMFKATKVDIKLIEPEVRGGCHDDESAKLLEPIR
jgi:hypothetical protein